MNCGKTILYPKNPQMVDLIRLGYSQPQWLFKLANGKTFECLFIQGQFTCPGYTSSASPKQMMRELGNPFHLGPGRRYSRRIIYQATGDSISDLKYHIKSKYRQQEKIVPAHHCIIGVLLPGTSLDQGFIYQLYNRNTQSVVCEQ